MLEEPMEGYSPLIRFVSHPREDGEPLPQTLDERMTRAPLRSVEAKEHVFSEGDHRSHLFRVESGAVCLYKVLPDGRRRSSGSHFRAMFWASAHRVRTA
jgi:CRP-like cAMP-binding protein